MIISRSDVGIYHIAFEASDTLEEIAAVSRCTSEELAELCGILWIDEWKGQKIDWEDDE